MKKIAIFSSFGTRIPLVVAKEMARIGKEFPQSRYGEIIDFIERIAEPITKAELSDVLLAKNVDKLYKVTDYVSANSNLTCEQYYGINDMNISACVMVYQIDETKKYIISDYDGAEGIRLLPEYKCIDSTLNLWDEVRP